VTYHLSQFNLALSALELNLMIFFENKYLIRSSKMHKIEGVSKLVRSTVPSVCTIESRNMYTIFRTLTTAC